MSATTMTAIRVKRYGEPEVLTLESVPRPQPQDGQVLLRVVAAGVNPVDWKTRAGLYKDFMPLQFPWTPGIEGAGIVEAVGSGVTAFEPGQAVFGAFGGSYAEYAAAAAQDVRRKPAYLTFEQAAGVTVGGRTALQAVEDAKIEPGQHVLVHGAAGGVGAFVVQLACLNGAHVIGTSSARNADFVRSLGAEQVIDYGTAKFETAVKNVDVVVDTVRGELIERSWSVLRPGGLLITVAGRLTPEMGTAHGVKAASVSRAGPDKVGRIAELLEAKQIVSSVGAVLPLAEARQAHQLSQTGHGRGRIVLLTA